MKTLNVAKMVQAGASSPDPSNRPNENFLPTDVGIIDAFSSDSEEGEVISYDGYEVLPQELCEINDAEEDDSENEDDDSDEGNEINPSFTHMKETPLFDQATKTELSELWNSSSSSRKTDIVMDSTKEEEIKNAMAGFKLPLTAIPSWAAQIPEEEWKEQLKNKVALLNKVPAV